MDEQSKTSAGSNVPNIQWFPGHMAKTRRLIQGHLKLVDVVIELLDARIPVSSANPLIREIVGDKTRLAGLKLDTLDALFELRAFYNEGGALAVAVNSTNQDTAMKVAELLVDRLIEEGKDHA